MTHQHAAKRPYGGSTTLSQPSITSYFSPSATTTTSSYSPSEPVPSLSPPLPPTVQSNLLSVGMRVRKSIPEGYKTGTYSAFTLFSDPTSLPQPSTKPQIQAQPRMRPRARELTPFCGILKVGGLGVQEMYNYDADGEGDAGDEEAPWLSSQGSTISSSSVGTVSFEPPNAVGMGHKRRFDVEEGEGEGEEDTMEETVLGKRRIAVPASRRRGVDGKGGPGLWIVGGGRGQENEDLDFGEADFLDYGLVERRERGEEVEMGGV